MLKNITSICKYNLLFVHKKTYVYGKNEIFLSIIKAFCQSLFSVQAHIIM